MKDLELNKNIYSVYSEGLEIHGKMSSGFMKYLEMNRNVLLVSCKTLESCGTVFFVYSERLGTNWN